MIVHAFEPNPPNRAVLECNVARNGADVTVHPFALGETDGNAIVYESAENAGAANLVHARGEGVKVDVRAGDRLALPPPATMKIDVETFESAVLRGIPEALKRRPVLCVEDTPGDTETVPLLEGLVTDRSCSLAGRTH